MNIIKRVKETLRKHKDSERTRLRAEQETMIQEMVSVREAGGHIWITVDGVGVRRMSHSDYHYDIMKAVDDTRKAAVDYWRQTHGYGISEEEVEP